MDQTIIIDENIPKSLAAHLNTRGFKTLCISDNFLKSAKDFYIADYAAKERLLILTLDSDFAQLYHNVFRGKIAVLLVKANSPTTENIIKTLDTALKKLKRTDIRNKLVIITKKKIRIIS